MKILLTILTICLSIVLYNNAIAETPHQIIKTSASEVLAAMKNNNANEGSEVEALATSMLKILKPVVDFKSISKAVMGKHYKIATLAQRKEFTPIFETTMIKLYAKSLIKFEIESIKVEDLKKGEKFKGKVVMEVKATNGNTYKIIYSMRKNKANNWKIRNVIIDGINLGLTYRNQFDSAMTTHQGNISSVIKGWAGKMDVAEPVD